ncbi:MAG: polyprenyl synthetase family protein [Archaeoglobaceae archaeon]|nr:polyprenyl synthetase family protein [Archaeoglobaceae archaeon]
MLDVKSEVAKRAEVVNEAISNYLPIKSPEGLYKATRHLINAGGKRLRPVLVLISTEALGKDWTKILPAAVAIETIHNFTLIHDDIMDRDEYRRGVSTVHKLFGEPTAILAGDTLFAEAFEILTKCEVEAKNLVKAVELLSKVCVNICEGQYLDMSFEEEKFVNEQDYIEMVKKKTAVLIAASTSLPAILFGESEKIINALWNFGLYCGIGFQIQDDVLDLVGKEKIGKDWGSDIVEGKKTLIVINAFEKGVELEIFGKGEASKEEIEKAVKKLEECGAIDYAKNKAKEYVEKAKKELDTLKDSKSKELLKAISDYLISRDY